MYTHSNYTYMYTYNYVIICWRLGGRWPMGRQLGARLAILRRGCICCACVRHPSMWFSHMVSYIVCASSEDYTHTCMHICCRWLHAYNYVFTEDLQKITNTYAFTEDYTQNLYRRLHRAFTGYYTYATLYTEPLQDIIYTQPYNAHT